MELLIDVGSEAELLDALDVAGPRAESDPIQHVRDRSRIRFGRHGRFLRLDETGGNREHRRQDARHG